MVNSRALVVAWIAFLLAGSLGNLTLLAQTPTSGAIAGTIFDPSGSVVPNAAIKTTRLANGATRNTKSGASGNYTIPLLDPGSYEVAVEAKGFNRHEVRSVSVEVSRTTTLNINLKVGRTTERVRVAAAPPFVETDNPNTTTTFDARTLTDLPNPGMDLTYVANFAPGAVINTKLYGHGNVEFNGLPSVANQFVIDGLDANDPLFNLNTIGASNLSLGMNAMQEVSINTIAYAVDQGRLGASQINYVTKSGSNRFHGNLYELWNGSALNATNYFVNANQFQVPEARPHKPRSNVNQFGGSLGGPIVHDKLFFFTDVEGIRIVLPIIQQPWVPSKGYQSYVLSQLPKGGCDYELSDCTDPSLAILYPSEAAEVPLYKTMFDLYGNVSGVPLGLPGCPLNSDGTLLPVPSPANPTAEVPAGDGCVNTRLITQSGHTNETLWTLKIDHNLRSTDTVWYHFQMKDGVQATYTDPINSVFDVPMPVSQRSGSASWVHTFSPELVNEFTPGFSWYSAIAQPANFAKALQTFPIVLSGIFTAMGGTDYYWPSGQNFTQWQLIDNLSWAKGRHMVKFGGNLRRVLISDHDFGILTVPTAQACTFSEFTYGTTCASNQNFPPSLEEPFRFTNLDLYAMDTMKLTPKLTLTLGVRAAWNSDPVNPHNHVFRLRSSWDTLSHDVDRPLNQDLLSGLSKVYDSTPPLSWQPRGALAYEFMSRTVLRAGFGVFGNLLPGSLGEIATGGAPNTPGFSGGLFGGSGGLAIAPGVPDSAIDALSAANQEFLANQGKDTLSCASPNADPENCVPPVGITVLPDRPKIPYFMQWSVGIQRAFATNWGLRVQYVGTRSVQGAYFIHPNGFQTACDGCYRPFPFGKAPDPRFGLVREYASGTNGNYNGLQISGEKRMSHGLQLLMNYTWSHCLDTVSNGGYFSFSGQILRQLPGQLRRFYGPCDYDIRHTLNGFYIYQLPFRSRERLLNHVVNGWQVSGSLILQTGAPTLVWGSGGQEALGNAGVRGFPNLVPGQPIYAKNPIAGVTPPGAVQWLNPYAFSGVFDNTTRKCVPASSDFQAAIANEGINPQLCQYGDMQRNFVRAPGFRWGDLYITRRFRISEAAGLRLEVQLYNFLNHPNFAPPLSHVGIPGQPGSLAGVGAITSTASPPTGLLGGQFPINLSNMLDNANLGGDTSVRMIAIRALFEF
jgi:Carboxypeptidase regulatory-like domain